MLFSFTYAALETWCAWFAGQTVVNRLPIAHFIEITRKDKKSFRKTEVDGLRMTDKILGCWMKDL